MMGQALLPAARVAAQERITAHPQRNVPLSTSSLELVSDVVAQSVSAVHDACRRVRDRVRARGQPRGLGPRGVGKGQVEAGEHEKGDNSAAGKGKRRGG